MDNKNIQLKHWIVFICLVVFAISTTTVAKEQDGLLKIYFLNVGQGDSMLVVTPAGYQILIDGGPDNSVVEKLGTLIPFYDSTLDLVIASHKHDDHIAGLLGVLDKYEVAEILDTNRDVQSSVASEWASKKDLEKAKLIETKAGDEFTFSDGVSIKILYPNQAEDNYQTNNPNNDSIVAMLQYGDSRILFMGDAEASAEKEILSERIDVAAEVLKIGHHGSKTSSTLSFLSAVSPKIGIIEVGEKNKYGLPSEVILSRLESSGIKYYRTDTDGIIEISSDGKYFNIIKQK